MLPIRIKSESYKLFINWTLLARCSRDERTGVPGARGQAKIGGFRVKSACAGQPDQIVAHQGFALRALHSPDRLHASRHAPQCILSAKDLGILAIFPYSGRAFFL